MEETVPIPKALVKEIYSTYCHLQELLETLEELMDEDVTTRLAQKEKELEEGEIVEAKNREEINDVLGI